MKPDKHKQKQSAKYKKKQDNDTKKSSNIPKREHEKVVEKGPRHTPVNNSDDKVSVSEKSGKVDSNTHHTDTTFNKRTIVSNWERYEEEGCLEHEAEELRMRGADFTQLLNEAGSASSQFRFRSEAEWDDSNEDDGVALSLDLPSLATSLTCVPLHLRLNLPEHMFLPEQIDLFNADAEENYKQWTSDASTVLPDDEVDLLPSVQVITTEASETCNTAIIDSLDEILNADARAGQNQLKTQLENTGHDINSIVSANSLSEIKDLDDLLDLNNDSAHKQADALTQQIGDEQEDLDILLGISEKHNIVEKPTEETDSLRVNVEALSVAKKVENNADICADTPLAVSMDSSFKPSKPESLDDWLDSVLDD